LKQVVEVLDLVLSKVEDLEAIGVVWFVGVVVGQKLMWYFVYQNISIIKLTTRNRTNPYRIGLC
jgi:hypothetical protein